MATCMFGTSRVTVDEPSYVVTSVESGTKHKRSFLAAKIGLNCPVACLFGTSREQVGFPNPYVYSATPTDVVERLIPMRSDESHVKGSW